MHWFPSITFLLRTVIYAYHFCVDCGNKENQLDGEKLLDASEYKEKYRAKMIKWGEERRKIDYGYFCRLVVSGPGSEKPLWIISDARRKTDLKYFDDNFSGKTVKVRITADQAVRCQRGWVFTAGVDDEESECDLDEGVAFDIVIDNSGTQEHLNRQLNDLIDFIRSKT